MAKEFALRHGETLARSFRRIAANRLEHAAEAAEDLSLEQRVHETRKRLKEVRALLRLFRDSLGDVFDEENHRLRDAGRLLAPCRDAASVAAAVEALPPEVRQEIGDEVRARRDAVYADPKPIEEAFAQLLPVVTEARQRLDALRLKHAAAAVEAGFAATLAAGRKAMKAAYHTDDPADFHEWRKRVKDHWYHVQLFVPAWPDALKPREKALDRLSHLLGEHHDLTVVRGIAGERPIAAMLIERQNAIATEARPLAERIYVSRPRDEAREMMALWRVWQR